MLKSRKNTSSFPADHAIELITSLTGIAISRDQHMRDVMCNFHLTNYIRTLKNGKTPSQINTCVCDILILRNRPGFALVFLMKDLEINTTHLFW